MKGVSVAVAGALWCTVGSLLSGCGPQRVTIEFYPLVGQEHFACTSAWEHVGVSASVIQPKDFRLLVSEVRLHSKTGTWIPMRLEEVEGDQHEGVALVDFENATGLCKTGTPMTRYEIEGSVAERPEFDALELTLGVPTGAELPSHAASLQGGGRARGLSVGLKSRAHPDWVFHLPPTCVGEKCSDDRLRVRVEGVDASKRIIIADLLELLREADLEQPAQAPDFIAGCASDLLDVDCAPLMRALGVGAPQRLFRPSPYAVGSIAHDGHSGH